ncbi:C_GCAxxG_C_C family protein [Alkalidesulfovibrio alkalitolerans DSM 16529]|uniref:C_GCAxxG_C_C family protein n=1 Tax=Alkalidesulfovibrio alkalitolerans DSM 16529 TaxID=1121439 RepID=S7UL40_9BACT|nr:C-GCAxxG-C-C family protein [Alkalidesulfovibrio alkalitolerans]EPR33048.1 C_GCAxxG_C_C family protein [Alkalidesulfovibrio alkalitolerans DSM 16529]
MERQDVEQRAAALFRSGLNCAESVLAAVLAGRGLEVEGVTRLGTAFGAGAGRSKVELCGALSGGFIALGYLRGRRSGDERWDDVAALAAGVRRRFEAEHGCTACGSVLMALGPQENMDKCIQLSAETAGYFHEALDNPQALASAAAAPCGCSARQSTPAAPAGGPATTGGCGGD